MQRAGVWRPMESRVCGSLALGKLVAVILIGLITSDGRADVWSYEHDGVVYFSNIPPSGRDGHRWSVVSRSGPGKAQTVSGVSGCERSRADVVPSQDQSPDRFHRYDRHIAEASTVFGLPEALIRAVIKVESDYDPRVVSCAGAKGLMQLMPDVATEQKVSDVFEPRRNILGGSRLLRLLANRFRGDLVLTIAGYHAGAGAVLKYDGVPPYETTQQYVRMVLTEYQRERTRLGDKK